MRARGYIDGIFGEAVRGWVVDLHDPANVLSVTVRLDGQELAAAAADEPRADLVKAGIGAGLGGFRVRIGRPPVAGPHEIVAVVTGTTTTVPLAHDFRLVDAAGVARPEVELYEGRADPAAQPARAAASDATAALAGERGWLFSCVERDLDLVRGITVPDPRALDRLVAAVERFHAAAADRGARCLVAVIPDKLHVYPEHAPATMPMYPAGRVAEHLAARAQDSDDVIVVDLLATLLRARAHGRVFSRAGAGPTWLGAFSAYRAIAKLLAIALPALRPLACDALTLGPDVPVRDAPEDAPLLRWQGASLVPDGSATGLAATALEPSLDASFTDPRPSTEDAAPEALIVHDELSRRVARLLAAHGSATLLRSEGAPDPPPAGQDLDLALWLVGDQSLTRLASAGA